MRSWLLRWVCIPTVNQRRSILAEKGECTASIASLQEEVVFLKRLIKEAENDLETHILLNETIRTQNKKAETEVEHLAGSRDTLLRALQNERIAVQQEERLVSHSPPIHRSQS